MKALFLDVDGVLNTEDSLGEAENDDDFIFAKNGASSLEKRCIQNLVTILVKTGAKIVVTSTWRMFPDMLEFLTETLDHFYRSEMERITNTRGENVSLIKSGIIGSTMDAGPPPFGGGRGLEVKVWLENHPECERFVIVDDDHKNSFDNALFGNDQVPHGGKGMLIETKLGEVEFEEQGLTREHVDIAVNFLNSGTL